MQEKVKVNKELADKYERIAMEFFRNCEKEGLGEMEKLVLLRMIANSMDERVEIRNEKTGEKVGDL